MLWRFAAWLRLNGARNWLADGSPIDWSRRSWHARTLDFADLRAVAERGGLLLAPYERLAPLYESYGDRLPDRYPGYLRALKAYLRQPCRCVLDLACGCGSASRQLARRCERVVGLDSSPAMLAVARDACGELPHVHFVEGDFVQFSLGQRFDAAVCSSDSLNYLPQPAALADVLGALARHLRPGGLFVFDVLSEAALQKLNGLYFHHRAGGEHFAMSFNYDPQTRRERTDVIFPEGLEQHHRIPIDAADVRPAASDAGYAVIEEFENARRRGFYALRLAGDRSRS